MKLAVGDKVSFKSDLSYGRVTRVLNANEVMVEDETGFDVQVKMADLYKVDETGQLKQLQVSESDIQEKVGGRKKKRLVTPETEEFLAEGADWLEIDLHIENLVVFPKRLSNAAIVQKQMVFFERYLKLAKQHRKRKYIIIHGVGTGVLKSEIRARLKQFEGIEVNDADYARYGTGATEVYIFQNPK